MTRLSVWLVSGYAHVFIKLFIVICHSYHTVETESTD